MFPAYLNGLKLKDAGGQLLTLDINGNGDFNEMVKMYSIASAQKAMAAGTQLSAIT